MSGTFDKNKFIEKIETVSALEKKVRAWNADNRSKQKYDSAVNNLASYVRNHRAVIKVEYTCQRHSNNIQISSPDFDETKEGAINLHLYINLVKEIALGNIDKQKTIGKLYDGMKAANFYEHTYLQEYYVNKPNLRTILSNWWNKIQHKEQWQLIVSDAFGGPKLSDSDVKNVRTIFEKIKKAHLANLEYMPPHNKIW